MTKILVVDDSPTEIFKLKNMLESLEFEVITAKNGRAGVDLAILEQPDCVLMDIVMPDMNGFQATRIITRGKTTSHMPVIIVSTKGQETDRVWGQRQGAKGYMVKPVTGPELVAAIKAVLE
ncbi:MAG: response regulator transcription factor [Pseudomonadales bacterium]|nr:response regulator transcription factor [Pseudomonadales bacterium]